MVLVKVHQLFLKSFPDFEFIMRIELLFPKSF